MNFIQRETKPRRLKINGVEYPAIWNFIAIARMEDYCGTMHLYTIQRFKFDLYTAKELIGAVVGMLSAAGVVCVNEKGEDMLEKAVEMSILPGEEEEITNQIRSIIADQGEPPEGDQKNA